MKVVLHVTLLGTLSLKTGEGRNGQKHKLWTLGSRSFMTIFIEFDRTL